MTLLSHDNDERMLTFSNLSLFTPSPSHLQVIQEPGEVQAPLSSIPVVVGPDVCEASISEHTIVVLWDEEENKARLKPWIYYKTECDPHYYHPFLPKTVTV